MSPVLRRKGLFTEFFHNYSSFLPGMRWRDFCLVHLSGEWNPGYGQCEWTIALLGVWYRGTYVYNPDTPELQELRAMVDELNAQGDEKSYAGLGGLNVAQRGEEME